MVYSNPKPFWANTSSFLIGKILSTFIHLSNKYSHELSWARNIEDLMNRPASKERDEKRRPKKCRGRDLNPRTPEGKDFPCQYLESFSVGRASIPLQREIQTLNI